MQLLEHQQNAIDKLQRVKVGALFMEPGTGKTLTAYTLIKSLHANCVLWLCPFQLKKQTESEINKYGGIDNIHYVGLESISASDRIYLETRSLLEKHSRCVIVVDESLKIKNGNAIRTKRTLDLATLSEFRLVLNGTPMTKNLLDIWAQFQFLSPKILNMPFAQFKNTFVEYVELKERVNGRVKKTEIIRDYHNVEYLFSLIEPYVFECALDLDVETSFKEEHYILSNSEKQEYEKIKKKFLNPEFMLTMNNNIFLALTTKMQHSYCTAECKFEVLDNILKRHDRSSVIVFCRFLEAQRVLKERYKDLEVLTYGKHAYGLNLQKYNVTVYFDKTFDYAQLTQSRYRTYRTGQDKECIYYSLTADTGLDKMINENIKRKQSLLDYFKQVGNKIIESL